MAKAIERRVQGIKCDAVDCDFGDENVTEESYPEWLNKPCPLCGANLLTEEDFAAVKLLHSLAELINTMHGEVPEDAPKRIVQVSLNGSGLGGASIEVKAAP